MRDNLSLYVKLWRNSVAEADDVFRRCAIAFIETLVAGALDLLGAV